MGDSTIWGPFCRPPSVITPIPSTKKPAQMGEDPSALSIIYHLKQHGPNSSSSNSSGFPNIQTYSEASKLLDTKDAAVIHTIQPRNKVSSWTLAVALLRWKTDQENPSLQVIAEFFASRKGHSARVFDPKQEPPPIPPLTAWEPQRFEKFLNNLQEILPNQHIPPPKPR